MSEPRPPLAQHPLMTNPPTAYGVALALAETFRPGRYVTTQDGYDVVDSAAITRDIPVVSTGEGVVLAVIRSLAGDAPVDLSRLDAVDAASVALLAEAIAALRAS